MAGSITGVIGRIPTQMGRPQSVKITLTCTADVSAHNWPATVVNTLTNADETISIAKFDLRGLKLYSVKMIGGETGPTAGSNLTITDMYGMDLLGGKGVGVVPTNNGLVWIPTGPSNYAFAALLQDTMTINLTGNSVDSAVLTLVLELCGD